MSKLLQSDLVVYKYYRSGSGDIFTSEHMDFVKSEVKWKKVIVGILHIKGILWDFFIFTLEQIIVL